MSWGRGYTRVHWSVFNIATRLAGIAAVLASLALGGWAIYFAIRPESSKNIETAGMSPVFLYVLAAVLVGLLGATLLGVRPYRPDLGDRTWTADVDTRKRTARHWWTGSNRK